MAAIAVAAEAIVRPNFEGFENNIAIYQWLVSHFEF
jgi:hypothetical protein